MELTWDQNAVVGVHTFVSEVHADFVHVLLAQAAVLAADTVYICPASLVVIQSANYVTKNFNYVADPTKNGVDTQYMGTLGPLNVILDVSIPIHTVELVSNGTVVANILLENVSYI